MFFCLFHFSTECFNDGFNYSSFFHILKHLIERIRNKAQQKIWMYKRDDIIHLNWL